jgi:hypothetical protein
MIIIKPAAKMMTINEKCLFLFAIVSLVFISNIQSFAQITDNRLRLLGEVETDIAKDINLSVEYEHRFNNNISTFDKALLEPSISYDLIKGVRVGAGYRFVLNQGRNSKEIQFRGRVSAYIRYRYRIDDFVFSFRSQLQYGFDDITYVQYYYVNELVNRNYVKVEYRWFGTKITPFVRYELYNHLNSPRGAVFNQWKLRSGFNYQITKKSRISTDYTYEKEFNVYRPINAHVFALGYRYSF